ncbi:MAG: septum formation initiator family protein [Clostridia bacterium]|nr:septum formation initiator family protein [Clostridia bacterium]
MVKVRVKRRKKRPKIHIPLFRIFAVLFGLMICFMLIKIPQTISRAEKTIVEVESSKNAYFSAEAKNRRLMEQQKELGNRDFIERMARRNEGYCKYGETVYVVSNIDDLRRRVSTPIENGDIELYSKADISAGIEENPDFK